MKKVSEEFKDLSNTKESSKRSIAYNRLRNLNSDEIKTHAEQIAKQVAFSTESLGGAKYKPVLAGASLNYCMTIHLSLRLNIVIVKRVQLRN